MTSINYHDQEDKREYSDAHGNPIGWGEYEGGVFRLKVNPGYANGDPFKRLHDLGGASLRVIDQAALLCAYIAEDAGF